MFLFILSNFLVVLGVLISVAFMTLMERKVLGLVGLRLGPSKVSLLGTLQPVADAAKLAGKQFNYLSNSSSFLFTMVGSTFLLTSLMLWMSSTYFSYVLNIKMDFLYILLVLSLNTISILYMGWVSYSKYSLIGCIRAATQTFSYEALIIIIILSYVIYNMSFKSMFVSLKYSLLFFMPLFFIMWIPTSLAEMGRTPYDFSEGESELVSGFNTEFGSKNFALIFLSEYANTIFLSLLTILIFFSSNSIIMLMFVLFFFIWIRSVLPRSRFDFLMALAWKITIPFGTVLFISMIILLMF